MSLLDQLRGQQEKQLAIQIRKQAWGQTRWQLEEQIREQVKGVSELEEQSYNYANTSGWAYISFLCDFYISVLNCICRQIEWSVVQSLVKYCGWILPYENICVVCDRPIQLLFDNENRLHAEGEPAIQFADGYSLYSYHGVTLPEKYGKLLPNKWQAKWLLEEDNVELRRVLIQGIGYSRICQELQAIELDS